MNYYHATTIQYEPGALIENPNHSDFYEAATRFINGSKPLNVPVRGKCFYLADSAAFAKYFLLKQGVDESDILVFEVSAENVTKAPFVITHRVHRAIESGHDPARLVAEYWNPKCDWSFYEYLTTKYEVIQLIDEVSMNEYVMQHRFSGDVDTALSLME